jgi:HEAT repeat protein
VDEGDGNKRLAVASMFSEMGPKVQAVEPGETGGFARSQAPLIEKLVRDARDDPAKRSLAVRQEALRALGSINADPKYAFVVAEAFDDAKEQAAFGPNRIGPQRVAADALGQMVRGASLLQKTRSESQTEVRISADQLLAIAEKAVQASAAGLKSSDGQVRALCMAVAQEAADALSTSNLIDPAELENTFAPPGRTKLSKDEIKELEEKHNELIKSYRRFKPLLDALRVQSHNINQILPATEEAWVRQKGIEALEKVAFLRLKLAKRFHSIPYKGKPGFEEFDPLQELLAKDKELVNITRLLGEGDMRVRLAALEFMESAQRDAAPALAHVIPLARPPERGGDESRLIRGVAARALSAIDPANSGAAIPGLAQLLFDPSLSVRREAVHTLKEFTRFPALQKDLKAVGPMLPSAVTYGDTDSRVAALELALNLGVDNARPVTATLVDMLKDWSLDPKLLVGAARVLGEFGAAGFENAANGQIDQVLYTSAINGLRRLIGHDDAEVRSTAADALLSLTQGDVPLAKE